MLETPFPFFVCKKPGEILIFGTFLAKKIDFLSILVYVHWKSAFESGHVWKRHCDVIRWPIFMILVSIERGDPTLYHGTKQSYFGSVNFKFIRGVPLGKPCYKKRLGRTRVKAVISLKAKKIVLCNLDPKFLNIFSPIVWNATFHL